MPSSDDELDKSEYFTSLILPTRDCSPHLIQLNRCDSKQSDRLTSAQYVADGGSIKKVEGYRKWARGRQLFLKKADITAVNGVPVNSILCEMVAAEMFGGTPTIRAYKAEPDARQLQSVKPDAAERLLRHHGSLCCTAIAYQRPKKGKLYKSLPAIVVIGRLDSEGAEAPERCYSRSTLIRAYGRGRVDSLLGPVARGARSLSWQGNQAYLGLEPGGIVKCCPRLSSPLSSFRKILSNTETDPLEVAKDPGSVETAEDSIQIGNDGQSDQVVRNVDYQSLSRLSTIDHISLLPDELLLEIISFNLGPLFMSPMKYDLWQNRDVIEHQPLPIFVVNNKFRDVCIELCSKHIPVIDTGEWKYSFDGPTVLTSQSYCILQWAAEIHFDVSMVHVNLPIIKQLAHLSTSKSVKRVVIRIGTKISNLIDLPDHLKYIMVTEMFQPLLDAWKGNGVQVSHKHGDELFDPDDLRVDTRTSERWLPWAAGHGSLAVVEYLLENCSAVYRMDNMLLALTEASCEGYPKIVHTLLSTGKVDINGKDPNGMTALASAANCGRVCTMKALLTYPHLDVNAAESNDLSPLMLAILGNRPINKRGDESSNIVEILLGVESLKINAIDKHGRTALHLASKWRNVDAVKYILATAGVDVNLQDENGMTPLAAGPESDCADIVRLLLQVQAIDVNICDNEGQTALHYTCRGTDLAYAADQYAAFELLVNAKDVDLDAEDNWGKTAYFYASEACLDDHVLLLTVKGASPVSRRSSNDSLGHMGG